ncbi:MAG TPA: amidohydrolase family protein [Bryobacteraceae bacterium]|nr:amidohydrolase family protein [Bryobacteraceae bacterium]
MQTPWGDCAVADAHVHFFSRHFFETLGTQCGKHPAAVADLLGWELAPSNPVDLARIWVSELDSHGVERAALIASVPGDEPSVLAAVAAHPNRFYAYAMVNPLAEHVSFAKGLHAICLFPAMHCFSVQDKRVEPLLEEAAARRAVVFVHCGVLTVGVRKKLGLPSPFDMRYSGPLELHAVALRHPRVRFVVPHFGAGYLREALMLADLCPNVFLDTSSSNSWVRYVGIDLAAAYRRALDVVGASRLLFGTDSSSLPRGWNYEIFATQIRALMELGISTSDARLILGENLKRIFSEA